MYHINQNIMCQWITETYNCIIFFQVTGLISTRLKYKVVRLIDIVALSPVVEPHAALLPLCIGSLWLSQKKKQQKKKQKT